MAIYASGFSGQDYFYPTAEVGTLTISGVSMHTWGWNVLDIRDLLFVSAIRGQDKLIPLVPGLRPYRRRLTATTHSLNIIISGLHALDGTPVTSHAARMSKLEEHLDFLYANVVAPVPTVSGTRPAVLLPAGSSPRTAEIHVYSLTPGTWTPATLRATLDISIPAGRFT
jgi:hypothetical protein